MLLRVGVIMIAVALALAAGVTAIVVLRAEDIAPASTPTEPLAVETKAKENKPDLGQKLEINDEPDEKPKIDEEPSEKPKVDDRPVERVPEKPPSEEREVETLPISVEDWPRPSRQQVAAANRPRYYRPPRDAELRLTVGALGLYDVPVISSDGLEALDSSLMHVPETSFPWDGGAQRNVYIAGHYLGYPGTASRLVFYNLEKLRNGDEVVLKDSGGRAYRYRVSESFTAMPDESWVMGQELNRDMVTLQTCIPPTFEERFVVQADRV